MCSSPKGGRSKPHLSSNVDGTFSNMNAVEYSNMVRRANESYEHRQLELIEYRKNKTSPLQNSHIRHISYYEKIKTFLLQILSFPSIRKTITS